MRNKEANYFKWVKGGGGAAPFTAVMVALLVLFLGFGPLAAGQRVTHAPAALDSLDNGLTWAMDTAKKQGSQPVFYIGFIIPRVEKEDNIHTGHHHRDKQKKNLLTLGQLVYGKDWLDNVSKKGQLDVALVLEYSAAAAEKGGPFNIKGMKLYNMNHAKSPAPLPLYWLGEVSNQHSTAFLRDCFKKQGDKNIKETILDAMGIHGPNKAVFRFLSGVLKNDASAKLREKAAFWTGTQQTPEAAGVLIDAIRNDSSHNVREHAVFGLSLVKTKEADDALIGLAKNGKDKKVRTKAIFWLGQRAVDKMAETLEDVVNEDTDEEILEAAVFALSQQSGGVSRLIKLAKNHRSFNVRKQAVFWLGQSGDPRGLELILKILK